MGESTNSLKVQFDRRVRLEFRGTTIASDAGLLQPASWTKRWRRPEPAFSWHIPGGDKMSFSQLLSQLRIRAVLPYCQGSILDEGCGSAEIIRHLPPGTTYKGLDRESASMALVPATESVSATFHRVDIENDAFPVESASFETCVMLAVMEHLHNPRRVLREIHRCLVPGGRLVGTTPTLWGGRVHYLLGRAHIVSAHAAKDHTKFWTPQGLAMLLEAHGFLVERCATFELGMKQVFVGRKAERETLVKAKEAVRSGR